MSDLSSIYCTSSLPTSIWLLSERKRTLTWLSSSMTLKYNCVGPGASPMMDIKSLTNASSMTLLGTFIVNFSMRSFFTVWRYSTFCMANEKDWLVGYSFTYLAFTNTEQPMDSFPFHFPHSSPKRAISPEPLKSSSVTL